MTDTEKRLYDLIMDIKEMQARIMVMLEEREEATRNRLQRLSILEGKVEKITTQVAGAKAWFAAAAAGGGIIGWVVNHFFLTMNNK